MYMKKMHNYAKIHSLFSDLQYDRNLLKRYGKYVKNVIFSHDFRWISPAPPIREREVFLHIDMHRFRMHHFLVR